MEGFAAAQIPARIGEWLTRLLAALSGHDEVRWAVGGAAGVLCRFLLPVLALLVVVRCARSLLQGRLESEKWGWLTAPDGSSQELSHWEVLVGRARSCDVVYRDPTVSRNHAVLVRNHKGNWTLYPLRSKNPVQVNGKAVLQPTHIRSGCTITLGEVKLTFTALSPEQEAEQAHSRTRPGRVFSPGVTLLMLSLFQALVCAVLVNVVEPEYGEAVLFSFGGLLALMWAVYALYRILRRTGFEIETLGFFLTTLCLTVTADSAPATLYKQTFTVVAGLVLFFALSIVLRDVDFAKSLRWPAAAGAGVLLAFNLLLGQRLFGAKNWISIGPVSFQPSELVKVIFVLVGATTLDRMFTRRNLVGTLVFSAYCVGCLALMSDFGTALVFFVAFLAIAFLRSGDLPSVAFMTAAAVFAGVLVLRFKPYVAGRFSIYRHVWDDPSNLGYQQTRTLSAIASGGLFGQGLGNGWLKHLGAANTDLVFGVIAEELGLVIALLAVIVMVLLALFAVKFSAAGRSSFYVIAACSAAMIFLVQTMLNVFGSTDLLPLTGVTLPFVSVGGTSMLSSWCMLAYIKASDTRQNAGLAVKLPSRRIQREPLEAPTFQEPGSGAEGSPTRRWGGKGFSARLSIHREEDEQ